MPAVVGQCRVLGILGRDLDPDSLGAVGDHLRRRHPVRPSVRHGELQVDRRAVLVLDVPVVVRVLVAGGRQRRLRLRDAVAEAVAVDGVLVDPLVPDRQQAGRVRLRGQALVRLVEDLLQVDRLGEGTPEPRVVQRLLGRVREEPDGVGAEMVGRRAEVRLRVALDRRLRCEVVEQVDVPGLEVGERRRVRAVLDVDDVGRGRLEVERLGRPPVVISLPHHRRRLGAEPGLVEVRAGADDARLGQVAGREIGVAELGEHVLRHDRHVEAVEIELLVPGLPGEREHDRVALHLHALQPGVLPERVLGMRRHLEQVEAVGDVARRHRLPVAPLHAAANVHRVTRRRGPLPPRGEPRDESALQRVVAERRLVGEADEPRDVVPVLGRIRVVVRRPLVAAHVERLRAR